MEEKELLYTAHVLPLQWPVSIITFLELQQLDEQREWLECFERDSECALHKAQSSLLNTAYGNDFKVLWVPDTIVACAAIITELENCAFDPSHAIVPIVHVDPDILEFFSVENSGSLLDSFYRKVFWKQSSKLSKYSIKAFEMIALFLSDNNDWIDVLRRMLEHAENIPDFNCAGKRVFDGKKSDILSRKYFRILAEAVRREEQAAQSNGFNLFRASKEFEYNGKIFKDFPAVDLNESDLRIPVSMSFNLNPLEGSFWDRGSSGARCLDYLFTPLHRGYSLQLSQKLYFESLINPAQSYERLFFIPPLSTVARVFGTNEFFHARSRPTYSLPSGLVKGIPVAVVNYFMSDQLKEYGIFYSKLSMEESLRQHLQLISSRAKWFEVSGKEDVFFDENFVLGEERIFHPFLLGKERAKSTAYSKENVFGIMLQSGRFQTPLHVHNEFGVSFDDIRKRVAVHMLAIPRAPHVNWIEFFDAAKEEEIYGFFNLIAETIEKSGIEADGYRLVSNVSLNPAASNPFGNDANQEIGHFHVHIAGGECLGSVLPRFHNQPLVIHGVSLRNPKHYQTLNELLFENYTIQSLVLKESWNPNRDSSFVMGAVRIPQLNNFMNFARTASADFMKQVGQTVTALARLLGIYESGFRVFINEGKDAWSIDDGFVIYLAGGAELNATVSNIYDLIPGDFDDLPNFPHLHCPATFEAALSYRNQVQGWHVIQQTMSDLDNLLLMAESIDLTLFDHPIIVRKYKAMMARCESFLNTFDLFVQQFQETLFSDKFLHCSALSKTFKVNAGAIENVMMMLIELNDFCEEASYQMRNVQVGLSSEKYYVLMRFKELNEVGYEELMTNAGFTDASLEDIAAAPFNPFVLRQEYSSDLTFLSNGIVFVQSELIKFIDLNGIENLVEFNGRMKFKHSFKRFMKRIDDTKYAILYLIVSESLAEKRSFEQVINSIEEFMVRIITI